jgi:hypothetical protein
MTMRTVLMIKEFEERRAVSFHHLHVEKPARRIDGPDAQGKCIYEVEGKSRPMLILGRKDRIWAETAKITGICSGTKGCAIYRAEGSVGYLVLSLQSLAPPDPVPWLRIPNLLPSRPVSYVDLRITCYPADSADRTIDRTEEFVSQGHFHHIRKELELRGLGYKPKWHLA